VAVNTDNSFLVVWESLENDPSRTVIRSRAFDADGNATGSEQVVNNVLTGQPGISYLDLAALVGGNYVAVWQSGPAGSGCQRLDQPGNGWLCESSGNKRP